jgi:hypothetical protein
MSIVKHYINEIGLNILLDCGIDVSSASVTKMEVSLPDGTRKEWAANVWTLYGKSNYLLYTTIDSDLVQIGLYKIQAYIKKTDGSGNIIWEALGETAMFTIYNRFK